MGSQTSQQRDNILPDTFSSEKKLIKGEVYNLNMHELRDEISNQKLLNEPFLFKGEIDLFGEFVETIMPFKYTETFENFLEFTDEFSEEGSIIVRKADVFNEIDKQFFITEKRIN